MTNSPIIMSNDLNNHSPVRLLYVPAGDEHPVNMTRVPIAAWIKTAKRSQTGFDDLEYWQAELEKLGIGPDTLTVVVDDGSMTEAARVWFILQYFGLPAAVLDGGLPELKQVPTQADPAGKGLVLKPGSGPVGLMSRHDLKDNLNRFQIFDARTAEEYKGEDLKGNGRGGHLPKAAHLDHRDLLDGGHLRAPSELATMMEDAGIDNSRPVVTHCNGGGRAALAALAALAAGQKDVRVYYLSFADWAADESCSIE